MRTQPNRILTLRLLLFLLLFAVDFIVISSLFYAFVAESSRISIDLALKALPLVIMFLLDLVLLQKEGFLRELCLINELLLMHKGPNSWRQESFAFCYIEPLKLVLQFLNFICNEFRLSFS